MDALSNTALGGAAAAGSTPGTICSRCGNYAALHEVWGVKRCAECLERRDRIETAPVNVMNLTRDTLALSGRVALPALLLALVFGSGSALVSQTAPAIERLYDGCVLIVAWGAIQRLAFMRTVHGAAISVSDALHRVMVRYGSFWGSIFMANIVTLLFTLLLIVPGVLRALSYAMTSPIAINENATAANTLELSSKRMRGHRGAAFGAVCLLALGLATVCFPIMLGVYGVLELSGVAFDEEGLPMMLFTTNLFFIGMIPLYVLPVVLQLKLAQPEPVSAPPYAAPAPLPLAQPAQP